MRTRVYTYVRKVSGESANVCLCVRETLEKNLRKYPTHRLTKIDKVRFYEPISAAIQSLLSIMLDGIILSLPKKKKEKKNSKVLNIN